MGFYRQHDMNNGQDHFGLNRTKRLHSGDLTHIIYIKKNYATDQIPKFDFLFFVFFLNSNAENEFPASRELNGKLN